MNNKNQEKDPRVALRGIISAQIPRMKICIMNHGDGFYPLVYKERSCDSQINITFELTQLTGPSIKGYDGTTYSQILDQFR